MDPNFIPDPSLGKSTNNGFMPDPNQSAMALGHSNGLLQNILSGAQNVTGAMKNFSTGVAQSELGTLQNIGNVVAQPLANMMGDKGQLGIPQENLQPQGAAQTTGYWTGELAQFLAPTDAVKGAELGIDATKLPTLAKVAAKAGTEAAAGGGVSLAQTKDPKQALTTAATFGALKGTTGIIGAGLKAIGLPEHLYSTVFKTSSADMLQELKSGGVEALQKSNPTMFKSFVDSGIVKVGEDGKPIINETIAKQALDKGLKGSINTMANAVVKGGMENESKAQAIVAANPTPLTIANPDKLSSVLKTVAADYADVGDGSTATKAATFAKALESGGGQIDSKTGLSLRRFLDGMRSQASYNPQAKLSTTATNFKYWSNAVRGQLNKIPGMAPVMKDYAFNIEALTALAKTAATRGNSQMVSLLDTMIFDGGLQEGGPGLGAAMGITRRILTTPSASTRLGSAVQNSGTMSKLGSLVKGGISKLIGGAGSQEQSTPTN